MTTAMIDTVLLIDDSETDNYLHKRVISKTGSVNKIIVFDYAEDALAFLKNEDHSVDLILLDVNMPRMNGFEFLDQYELLPANRRARTVVIMLTTSQSDRDRQRALKYQTVSRFLHKPLTGDILQELFAELNR